jgi:hypothetical protein
MAVGLKRAHAQFVSQGESLQVVGLRLLTLWGLAMRCNVAKETQGIRLVTAFLAFTSQRQCVLGEGVRLFSVASPHLRFPQEKTAEHLGLYSFGCHRLFQRPREQRHGVSDVPSEGVHRT